MTNRQWLYAKQPAGKIGKDTFQWAETAIPAPREGEVLVRTRMLSLDAANRAWMMGKTYRAALEFGQVMSGFAIAEVVESRADGFAKGDIVEGDVGWQDYAALPARHLTKRLTKAPLEHLIGDLERGAAILRQQFGARALPVLVPPWSNARVTPASRSNSPARPMAYPLPTEPRSSCTPGRAKRTVKSASSSSTKCIPTHARVSASALDSGTRPSRV